MKSVEFMIFYNLAGTPVNVPPITKAYDNGLTWVEVNEHTQTIQAYDKTAPYELWIKAKLKRNPFNAAFPMRGRS